MKKRFLFCACLFLLITSISSIAISRFDALEEVTTASIIPPKKIGSSTDIYDNGVYFIKNVKTGKLIDIPNSNYATGTNQICYSPSYSGISVLL